MFSKCLLLLFCALLHIEVNKAENYKSCDIHTIKKNCPENAACTERSNSTSAGDCLCQQEFEFNAGYHNDSDYCTPRPVAVVQPTTATASSLSRNTDKTASAIAQNQPPGSHHIVGGILIPVFLVLVVIGVAFGIKRLHVVKRVRDMMAARRSRPFYEDVMMSNDNDDPPLI